MRQRGRQERERERERGRSGSRVAALDGRVRGLDLVVRRELLLHFAVDLRHLHQETWVSRPGLTMVVYIAEERLGA